MTVDKINPGFSTQQILNERLKEATSGKKNSILPMDNEQAKEATGTDKETIVFSDDAKKLQETEVILRNALQKLHEMDEINEDSLSGFSDKVNNRYYENNDEVSMGIADLIIPEEEMRHNIQMRFKAEEYVDDIKEFDEESNPVDFNKLNQIKNKIANGFYSQENVLSDIADNILSIMS